MDPVERLCNIIDASLQSNSLEKLNSYLSSLKNASLICNGQMVLGLEKLLRKRGKHEEKTLHVSCVLTCLEYLISALRDLKELEKISEELSKLCEIVFVISYSFIKDDALVQRVVNFTSARVECHSLFADCMLKHSGMTLLASCLCDTLTKYTRLCVMTLIGSLLQKTSRAMRTEILPNVIGHLRDLSNILTESDDYETQVAVTEILARSLIFIKRNHKHSFFTNNPEVENMFEKYHPFLNFDPDCRLFLNEVNESLGKQRKVISVPCMLVWAESKRFRKPNDPAYSDFWVDFNLGSRSVSFYHQLSTSDNWELMTVSQDKVIRAVANNSFCQSSRNGEKIEAVKLELIIDSPGLSRDSELPQYLKIYTRKEKFIKIEPTIQQIFNGKYKTTVVHNERSEEQPPGNPSNEGSHSVSVNGFCQTRSNTEAKNLSKLPDNKTEDHDGSPNKSKTKSSHGSGESDEEVEEEEESAEDSCYSRFIKEKMLQEDNIKPNIAHEDEVHETRNTNGDSGLLEGEKTSVIENLNQKLRAKIIESRFNENDLLENSKSPLSCHRDLSKHSSAGSFGTSLERDRGTKKENITKNKNISEVNNYKKRINTSELGNSKKKRLYSFERSNAQDVVMSSQDQELSVEIPSYKFTKKETYVKTSNINRKNISYSYITNIENEKSAPNPKNDLQKFNFSEKTLNPPADENSSGSDSESSLFRLFKDPLAKPKVFSKTPEPRRKKFFCNPKEEAVDLNKDSDKLGQKGNFQPKSVFSDFDSPEERERFKCDITYGRPKPKKPWRRLRKLPVESSDSDSQLDPPTELLKETNKVINTRYAAQVVRRHIDPIREDKPFTNEMELEAANDFEEPAPKPREFVIESPLKQGNVERQLFVKIVQGINTNGRKKKPAKQTKKQIKKNKKNPEPENHDDILKQSEKPTDCMDIVNFILDEPPAGDLDYEDLALDFLSNDDQQKTSQLHTNFKVSDMVRFGKLLMKQIQEKFKMTEKLATKQRAMTIATFDYKIQASYNALYDNCQKMQSVTDKLEALNTMIHATCKMYKEIPEEVSKQSIADELKKLNTVIQTTYNLHKEITAPMITEVSKIEEAKNEILKDLNKIQKTESSNISSIFQGFGGYIKNLVSSLFKGRTTKSAITK